MMYPVCEDLCSKCPGCQLVNKRISGEYLKPTDRDFQCISGAEADCQELYEIQEAVNS